ncbi:MAG: glutathione S-transferase family protein [Pseudomonadota bacterium]
MTTDSQPGRFRLDYWPLPFRGCFVSYLFAYRDVPLKRISDLEIIDELRNQPADEQVVPFLGPPVLHDLELGRTLSQMPAIVLYAAGELDLLPDDPFDVAMSLKVLMDCNDVLMEICRYNGSMMWTRDTWREFRTERFVRWLSIFEASLARGHFGGARVTFADIGVYALFGNMVRCLTELDADVRDGAPGVYEHCRRIGAHPSLAAFVADEAKQYGTLYCGGQIEASIRAMLAADNAE